MRGETWRRTNPLCRTSNFNPLAPCGARRCRVSHRLATHRFQSTRPVRGETDDTTSPAELQPISIHSPRAGRDGRLKLLSIGTNISIHSPRAGRDYKRQSAACSSGVFQSTRPVRGETCHVVRVTLMSTFQSTRPVRGETGGRLPPGEQHTDFNPLAPCGARRF